MPTEPEAATKVEARPVPRPGARARWLGVGWVLSLLGYSVARALAVAPALGPYGVNPWLFFALDVGSALPLALGQLRLIAALRAQNARAVQGWIAVVAVAFLAPYAYLLLGAGRPLPTVAYVLVATLVLGLGFATAWRVRQGARG